MIYLKAILNAKLIPSFYDMIIPFLTAIVNNYKGEGAKNADGKLSRRQTLVMLIWNLLREPS